MVLGYLLEKAAMQKRYLSQSPFLGTLTESYEQLMTFPIVDLGTPLFIYS